MKKYILVLLTMFITLATVNASIAKTTSNKSLAGAIKLYKAGNYSQCYLTLSDIVKKDPSNAVAYYYLAMTSAQIGKRDEALDNYQKVLTLSSGTQLGRYAEKGKTCLESPDKCNEETETSALDAFIQGKFGSGFSEEARSEYEKQKIENLMREMNRKDNITPQKFKEYKDFSNAVPSNDEIVAALRVLQRAGFGNIIGNSSQDLSLITGNSSNNAMLNLLMGNNNNSSLNPQVIQSLLTNQLGF